MTQIPARVRAQVIERDFYKCCRCNIPTYDGQWHHRRSRSVRDAHQHCACNGVYLCRDCHAWVHAHPFEARRQGFIVSRAIADPGTIPIDTQQHGWVLFDHNGGVSPATDPTKESE